MTLPSILVKLDYDDSRDTAIHTLNETLIRLKDDPFYIGLAIGKAMAYWSVYLISYEEYQFYTNAIYGYVFGKYE